MNDKIIKKRKNFIEEFRDYGITKGDITITVNNNELLSLPISVLSSYSFNDVELVDLEGYMYPETEDVVVTSIQNLEGIFMDVIFITKEEFDIRKLKFIQKEIQDENEKTIVSSLISEVYYDGEQIIFTGNNTDLRMAKVYYDVGKEKVLKK